MVRKLRSSTYDETFKLPFRRLNFLLIRYHEHKPLSFHNCVVFILDINKDLHNHFVAKKLVVDSEYV